MMTFFNISMKKVIIKQFSIDFCGLKGQIAIGVFYKLAWGDFEAIMQQKSLMNEGAMRASWLNGTTNEARAETKLALAMPCKEEEDEVK